MPPRLTPLPPLSLPSPPLLLLRCQVQDEGGDVPGGRARRPRHRRPPARGREAARGAATALHPGARSPAALSPSSRWPFLFWLSLVPGTHISSAHSFLRRLSLTTLSAHVSPSRLSLMSLPLSSSRWWGRRRRAPWSSTRKRPWPRCGWLTPRKPRYTNTWPSRYEGFIIVGCLQPQPSLAVMKGACIVLCPCTPRIVGALSMSPV
jgi:hypothetical protein